MNTEQHQMVEIEALARQIHQVWCSYYLDIKGKEYWTKGHYTLLDEEAKESDRYLARFILENFEAKEHN